MRILISGTRRSAIIFAIATLTGCGVDPALELDKLELLPPEEETIEFPLGEFDIPIPEEPLTVPQSRPPRNYMELEFSLFAEILPENQERLAAVFAHREGMFRDRVFQVCRNASVEDLSEPNLLTLKFHLQEACQPILGMDLIRRIGIDSLTKFEL